MSVVAVVVVVMVCVWRNVEFEVCLGDLGSRRVCKRRLRECEGLTFVDVMSGRYNSIKELKMEVFCFLNTT